MKPSNAIQIRNSLLGFNKINSYVTTCKCSIYLVFYVAKPINEFIYFILFKRNPINKSIYFILFKRKPINKSIYSIFFKRKLINKLIYCIFLKKKPINKLIYSHIKVANKKNNIIYSLYLKKRQKIISFSLFFHSIYMKHFLLCIIALLAIAITEAQVVSQKIGSSANLFSYRNFGQKQIYIRNDLNTVSFVFRNNPTVSGGGHNGHIRYNISQDRGLTWAVPLTGAGIGNINPGQVKLARYPNCFLFSNGIGLNNLHFGALAPLININGMG